MAQIPVKVADGTRVHEALQCAVEFTECPTEVFHQANERLASASGVPANQLTRRTACVSPVALVTDGR